MAVEIGKKFSPEMSSLLKSSLTGKDITQIAAKLGQSYYTVKSLIYREKSVTKNTIGIALEILKESIDVNRIEITRRRTANDEIKKITQLSEQAA